MVRLRSNERAAVDFAGLEMSSFDAGDVGEILEVHLKVLPPVAKSSSV
ncbi:MAG TPA: hypothetical protein VKU19_12800 [Bryobacteraceae bacterium]|nr:hypothetical protein [Bryobacteraceae bacterium]